MTRDTGHLFVVHGRIETLIHDAAIIPVGQEFRFAPYWHELVGGTPRKPERWHPHGWGRTFDCPDRVWSVSVGGATADPYPVILGRIRRVPRPASVNGATRTHSSAPGAHGHSWL